MESKQPFFTLSVNGLYWAGLGEEFLLDTDFFKIRQWSDDL